MVEADHMQNAGRGRTAADQGKFAPEAAQGFVGMGQHGEAAAVNVAGVGKIQNERPAARGREGRKTFAQQRRRSHVNVAPGGDNDLVAGDKRSQAQLRHQDTSLSSTGPEQTPTKNPNKKLQEQPQNTDADSRRRTPLYRPTPPLSMGYRLFFTTRISSCSLDKMPLPSV
jgi:hypothetical protein